MQRFVAFLVANRTVAVVTFEVFWIVVFLIHAASSAAGPVTGGFVYANF